MSDSTSVVQDAHHGVSHVAGVRGEVNALLAATTWGELLHQFVHHGFQILKEGSHGEAHARP